MKRILLSLFLAVFVFSSIVNAQQQRLRAKTSTAKRSASVGSIRDCPDEGGHHFSRLGTSPRQVSRIPFSLVHAIL